MTDAPAATTTAPIQSNGDAILEQYFGYLPNQPLAVAAAIAYFVVSLPLFWQSGRNRNKLTLVLPITGLVECLGYIVRLAMVKSPSQSVYILMALLIILAPNALAFANYKMLGKIIQTKAVHLRLPSAVPPGHEARQLKRTCLRIPYLMNEYGEVHGSRLAAFFFISDVAAIFLQGTGGGMQGGGQVTLGTDVLLFGLGSQLFFFGVFTLLAIYVYKSPIYLENANSATAQDDGKTIMPDEYDKAFIGLFATIAFLYVRNIYRVIEFTMGYRGYLATTEAFMYFFDTLFIFIAFLLYIWYNFAHFLNKADAQVQREQSVSDLNGGAGLENSNNANGVILVRMAESASAQRREGNVEMV